VADRALDLDAERLVDVAKLAKIVGISGGRRPGPGRGRLDSDKRLLDAANGGQGAFVSHGQGIARVSRPASRRGRPHG